MTNRLPSKPAIVCACLLALVLAHDAAWTTPFPCTGEAFAIQEMNAQLNLIDQTTSPFVFTPIGGPAGIEINNLGFRRTDGLLYAYRDDATIVTIDDLGAGVATALGLGGLPAAVGTLYNAGDVSVDGTEMYFSVNGQGDLHTISLPGLAFVRTVTIPSTGLVLDWAQNPTNGLLYGGDRTDGELAEVDPVTGARTDKAIIGGPLPTGISYGASWFDAAGTLFLYLNTGTIYEIAGATTATPTLVGSGPGESSPGFNDGAACIQDVIGAAKQMTLSNPGLPTTITIDYVIENFSLIETLSVISATDNLSTSFGTPGVDWTFTSISSVPAAFANPDFDGSTDLNLVNQTPTQTLAPATFATITVEIELLTDAAAVSGELCNQVVLFGTTASGVVFGDLSTDGSDPDPNGDGDPVEDDPSCVTITSPGLDLVKTGALDLGPDGEANPGDVIDYTFVVTNTGDVTLTDVLVSDPMVSPITCPSGNPIPVLDPGESETCTGSYTITQADVDAGQKDNTATADSNETPPVTDDHTEPIPQNPAIDLVKTGALDPGPDGNADPGDLIDYVFVVTNTGNVTLTDVLVSDPMVSPITCPSGNPIPVLAPGESETCTGSYAITQEDIDAGQKDNTATATGQDPNDNPVSDDDSHSEPLPEEEPPVTEIPTLSPWSLAGFALILLSLGALVLRRRLPGAAS